MGSIDKIDKIYKTKVINLLIKICIKDFIKVFLRSASAGEMWLESVQGDAASNGSNASLQMDLFKKCC